jgi:SAM-dependent methyltransferase
MNLQQDQWNAAYERGDNQMLYPKEEVVKFLNRYIRKRTGPTTFRDILPPAPGRQELRGLDCGCGIGRHVLLLEEFGVRAWGVEISPASLRMAAGLCDYAGRPDVKERLVQVDGLTLPFDDGFFDVGVSSGVLDSMHHEVAQRVVRELDRVVARVLYVDLISGDNDRFHREFADEEIVTAAVEEGTVQNYYNWTKLQQLFAPTRFRIRACRLITEQSVIDRFRYSRYHVVLHK